MLRVLSDEFLCLILLGRVAPLLAPVLTSNSPSVVSGVCYKVDFLLCLSINVLILKSVCDIRPSVLFIFTISD